MRLINDLYFKGLFIDWYLQFIHFIHSCCNIFCSISFIPNRTPSLTCKFNQCFLRIHCILQSCTNPFSKKKDILYPFLVIDTRSLSSRTISQPNRLKNIMKEKSQYQASKKCAAYFHSIGMSRLRHLCMHIKHICIFLSNLSLRIRTS